MTLEDYGWGEGGEHFSWFGDADYYYSTKGLGGEWRSPDAPLRPDLPRPYVIGSAMGSLGYALGPDVRILDTLGLADAFTSHLATTSEPVGALHRTGWRAMRSRCPPRGWLPGPAGGGAVRRRGPAASGSVRPADPGDRG